MSSRPSSAREGRQTSARAERELIGALLIGGLDAFDRVTDIVGADDLAEPRHRVIFDAIAARAKRREDVDAVLVLDELEQRGKLADAGGEKYLEQIVEKAASAANIESYARIAVGDRSPPADRLRVIGAAELLDLDLPPRVALLSPWLPRQGLAMIYARRGVGKTHFALQIGWAIACGSEFLGVWRAPEAAGVLFLDGEMPAVSLRERIARMAVGQEMEPRARFDIVTPDLQAAGMPDLASEDGQRAIDRAISDDHALIIVDNLSSLCRSGKENEAESWSQVQSWALRHRSKGRSVLFVHHAGKGGQQRGTSRREDVLDTVISLQRPADYQNSDGARFTVTFEKARGLHGEDVDPFEAALSVDAGGRQTWTTSKSDIDKQILQMVRDGMKPDAIASELNISRATAYRRIKAAKDDGRLPPAANVTPIRG